MKSFINIIIAALLLAGTAHAGLWESEIGNAADDTAYDATSWNDNDDAATKNALRDKIETLGSSTMGAWGASSEITLGAGGIAALPGQAYFTIDTFADAASDDMVQITGLDVGDEIIIGPNNGARTVVAKNGANMALCDGADFVMNNTSDRLKLQCVSAGVVAEITRSSGGN